MDIHSRLSYAWRALILILVLTHINLSYKQQQQMNRQFDEIRVLQQRLESMDSVVGKVRHSIDSLWRIHPWKKFSSLKRNFCKSGTFLGFVLYTKVDTSICPKFRSILASYEGPKVKVNCLRRHDPGSKHHHGQAVDLELSDNLVSYLISENGQKWLKSNSLMFYIEGNPKKKTRVYEYNQGDTAQYVFLNRRATGDHIHLAIKA